MVLLIQHFSDTLFAVFFTMFVGIKFWGYTSYFRLSVMQPLRRLAKTQISSVHFIGR
jgi:hypothetical protein